MSKAVYAVAPPKPTYTDITPKMTDNTAPSGYTASASSVNDVREPWKAFNSIIDNEWHSAGGMPQWIMLKFPSAKAVHRFSITNNRDSNFNVLGIGNFKLQGSNNGSSFTDLGSYTNVATLGATTTFEVQNPGSYQYYRVYITSANYVYSGVQYAVIEEIKFYTAVVDEDVLVTRAASKMYRVIEGVTRRITDGYVVTDGNTKQFL